MQNLKTQLIDRERQIEKLQVHSQAPALSYQLNLYAESKRARQTLLGQRRGDDFISLVPIGRRETL